MHDLKDALSDVLNQNNYDKKKKKQFLTTITKLNSIKLPVNSKSVKINNKGQVFVKAQKKKFSPSSKVHGNYVPYDLQNGIRLDSARKSDIDEDEKFLIARQRSRDRM